MQFDAKSLESELVVWFSLFLSFHIWDEFLCLRRMENFFRSKVQKVKTLNCTERFSFVHQTRKDISNFHFYLGFPFEKCTRVPENLNPQNMLLSRRIRSKIRVKSVIFNQKHSHFSSPPLCHQRYGSRRTGVTEVTSCGIVVRSAYSGHHAPFPWQRARRVRERREGPYVPHMATSQGFCSWPNLTKTGRNKIKSFSHPFFLST